MYLFIFRDKEIHRAGYIRISKDTNIMIGETFMHLKASLFDRHHSLQHITSVFVPFLFFSYLIFFPGHQRASVFWTQ